MKTLPLILAAVLGISVTGIQAETAPPLPAKTTPTSKTTTPVKTTTTEKTTKTTSTTSQPFNVLVIHNNPSVPTPSKKTVFNGKSVFIIGGVTPKPDTKLECCFDQYGKVNAPITSLENLKTYDITGDGVIDVNEAGYNRLFVGVATAKDNNLKVLTFKEAGIKSIILPGATNASPMVEFTNLSKSPLVTVTVTPDK